MKLVFRYYLFFLSYGALLMIFLSCFQPLFTPLAHASISNGANAIDALGQYDGTSLADPQPTYTRGGFFNRNDTPNRLGFSASANTAIDTAHHRLFVVDASNHRILVYNLEVDNTFPDRVPDNVLGVASFIAPGNFTTQANLTSPFGIVYDSTNDRLFVSQISNSRISVFDVASITDGENAVNVLGPANFTSSGTGTSQAAMTTPYGMAYDTANSRLFVADSGNNRVLVYDVASITNGENAVNVLGQANFTSSTAATTQAGMNSPRGITYDSTNNRLFVSQTGNHRVTVYDVTAITDGENAVNVLGQANFTSGSSATTQAGLSSPYGMAYTSTSSLLFVADSGNNRGIIYDITSITDGENAVKVLGQTNFTSGGSGITQSTLSPSTGGVTYDSDTSRLFFADSGNNRVMIFDVASITDGENAVDGLGQYDGTSLTNPQPAYTKSTANDVPNRLGYEDPQTLALDSVHHRLFVNDATNNRIMVYNLNTDDTLLDRIPDNVLGQTSFITKTAATTQAGMNSPYGLAYDSTNNRLFVSQTGNHRVTVYDVTAITDGENAVNVLGQANFTSGSSATTQAGMSSPRGMSYDSVNSRLFVADSGNNRTTVYDVASITDGENAVNVLGQINFTSSTATTTQAGMNGPRGVAYDAINNRLFVSQVSSNRVTIYDVTSISNGQNATGVLGQANFTSSTSATTAATMSSPSGVEYDSTGHRLFVTDGSNGRVTVFDVTTITNGENATHVLGSPNLTTLSSGTTQARFSGLISSVYDSTNNRLLVADTGNNRIMIFDVAATGTPLAYPAGTSTVSNPTTSTLNLSLSTNNNTTSTTYAILNNTSNIYVTATGSSNGATAVFFTSSSWNGTVTGLTPNTSYQFSVIARNSDGINAATSSLSTAIFTLAQSSTPIVSNPTTSTLALLISTGSNPTSTTYAVYNSTNGIYSSADGLSTSSTPIFFTSSSWNGTVYGLSSNTSYQFSVVAQNGSGVNSATSSLSVATSTLALSPNTPGAPTISSPTTSTLQLTLNTNNNSTSTTYAIYNNTTNMYVAANGANNGTTAVFFVSSSWTGTVTGLNLDTSYQFSVIAQSPDILLSPTSSLSSDLFTLANPALAPTITNPTTSTLSLTINTNGNPTSTTYAIYNSTDNVFLAANGSVTSTTAVFFTSSSWNGIATGLSTNTSYQFSTISRNGDAVNSATSSLSVATSTLAGTALIPGAPTINNPTTSSLQITIDTNGNDASVTYALYNSITGEYLTTSGTGNATAIFFSSSTWNNGLAVGLNLDTAYQFVALAKSSSNLISTTSSPSAPVFTLATTPGTPLVSNPTTSTLQLGVITNGNPTTTRYALYNVTDATYLSSNGTASGTIPIFFTSSSWNGSAIGLNPNTSYQFSVVAQNGDGIFTTTSSISNALATLSVSSTSVATPLVSNPTTSTLQVVIDTTGQSSGTTFAVLNVSNQLYISSTGTTIGSTPIFFATNTWSEIVKDLQINTSYQFQVITSGHITSSASTPVYTLSSVPYDLASSASTQSTITLTWNGQGSSFLAINDTNHTTSSWFTGNSFISTNLDCASTYTLRIKSRNGDGIESSASESLTTSTNACSNNTSLVGVPGLPFGGGGGTFVFTTPPAVPLNNTSSDNNLNKKENIIPQTFPFFNSTSTIISTNHFVTSSSFKSIFPTSSVIFTVFPPKNTLYAKEKLVYTYQAKNSSTLRRLIRVIREVRNEKGKLINQGQGYRTLAPKQAFSFSPKTSLPRSTPPGTYTLFVKIYDQKRKFLDQNGFKFKIIP
jgi:DNA-binding beta-propeller fold protein YncE